MNKNNSLLTPTALKVYSALLETAGLNLTDLSRATGVDRATCFRLMAQLQGSGLVFTVNKGRRKIWLAKSPEGFSRQITRQLELLKKLFTQTKQQQRADDFRLEYRTAKEIEEFVANIILTGRPGEEICCFMPPQGIFPLFEDQKRVIRLLKLRAEKRILVKAIMSKVDLEPLLKVGEDWSRYRIIKLLDQQKFPINAYLQIWRNKVMLGLENKKWVVIESRQLSKTIKSIFNYMWDQLKQEDLAQIQTREF